MFGEFAHFGELDGYENYDDSDDIMYEREMIQEEYDEYRREILKSILESTKF